MMAQPRLFYRRLPIQLRLSFRDFAPRSEAPRAPLDGWTTSPRANTFRRGFSRAPVVANGP
jgi:hypothetical protein